MIIRPSLISRDLQGIPAKLVVDTSVAGFFATFLACLIVYLHHQDSMTQSIPMTLILRDPELRLIGQGQSLPLPPSHAQRQPSLTSGYTVLRSTPTQRAALPQAHR